MKKAVILTVAILGFLVAAFFVTDLSLDAIARSKANEICSSAKSGMSKAELISLVNEKGGYVGFGTEELIVVGASAPLLICRCDVNMRQEIIISAGKVRCME
jgi:hypothetical protein